MGKKTCPECNGTKQVLVEKRTPDGRVYYDTKKCPACKGRGWIKD